MESSLKAAFVSGLGLLMLTVPVAGAHAQSNAKAASVLPIVDAFAPKMNDASRKIWHLAEVGFKETKSAKILRDQLVAAGFRIEEGVAGMPTAFIATAGSGGPVIALLAEYDALIGASQDAVAEPHPIEGDIAGHACGHNLLGSASVAAAIAVKDWLAKNDIKGTIRLYGTPAEEGGFSKVYMVRDGYFKDVDLTLSWHPSDRNSTTPSRTLAMIAAKFNFKGISSHAAGWPENGRSALDGVEIMNVAVNFMREHVPQDARIHYVITNGGGQPNVVPATAQSFYYIRHHDAEVVRQLWDRIAKAGEGAALATGTTMTKELVSGAFDTLPNVTLNQVMHDSLKTVGSYKYDATEAAFAKKIVAGYANSKISVANPEIIEDMTAEKLAYGTTDVGDISWVTPTATLVTASYVPGTQGHTWQSAATSGTSIGDKGALVAAKTMAHAAATLFLDPALIAKAKKEFEDRRGPNFKYQSLLGDRKPALDFADK